MTHPRTEITDPGTERSRGGYRQGVGALVRMRLAAFLRTGRVVAPLLAMLILLSILYGGGQADPAEAYGVSAMLMFPVLAWQTKLLLDTEPDVQRRLAFVAVGGWYRESTAGLVAAVLTMLPMVALGMAVPWVVGGVHGPPAVALGIWAHLMVVPPAAVLGAWSSRVIVGTAGRAVAVLSGGVVLALVLGLRGSPAPFLAPPIMHTARDLANGAAPGAVAGLTGWALAWTAVALAGYGWLRRTRA